MVSFGSGDCRCGQVLLGRGGDAAGMRFAEGGAMGAPVVGSGAGSRSASVVFISVLTIEKRTRVHSSLVGHTWSGS